MDHEPTRPSFLPSEATLDYWKKFLTTLLLVLATPYLTILLFRAPGKAATISSAI